jgi:hypothetical protein
VVKASLRRLAAELDLARELASDHGNLAGIMENHDLIRRLRKEKEGMNNA